MSKKIADLIFGEDNIKISKILFDYPERNIDKGVEVTRVAPSPTGFFHIGGLYMALICHSIAKKTKGKFLLRIEDTDSDREVEGAKAFVVQTLKYYGLNPDEGVDENNVDYGVYGPYTQSQRKEIYKTFAKSFVEAGLAYPCFMSQEDLKTMRDEQDIQKIKPGYYGKYALWRDRSYEDIKKEIDNGKDFVIRFRSDGNESRKFLHMDEFFGSINLVENDEDFVILKRDGGTTYHFANVVDDFLMGITFVVRGEEWMASLAKHFSLWHALSIILKIKGIDRSVKIPKYGHIVPINKIAESGVRKLSKRKDPEATMEYYEKVGIPRGAVIAYLYRLANPNFDMWWQEGNRDLCEYVLNLDEMKRNSRGPLLDFKKLDSFSADLLASFTAKEVKERIMFWCERHDAQLLGLIKKDEKYFENILNIERDGEKIRKDLTKYSEARDLFGYFFDDIYKEIFLDKALEENKISEESVGKICRFVLEKDNFEKLFGDDVDMWVSDMKMLAEKQDMKLGDFMKVLRVILTGKNQTPNMLFVFNVMGRDRVRNRLEKFV